MKTRKILLGEDYIGPTIEASLAVLKRKNMDVVFYYCEDETLHRGLPTNLVLNKEIYVFFTFGDKGTNPDTNDLVGLKEWVNQLPRDDADLIAIAEELGDKFAEQLMRDHNTTKISLIEIPIEVDFVIGEGEMSGREYVREKTRFWYMSGVEKYE